MAFCSVFWCFWWTSIFFCISSVSKSPSGRGSRLKGEVGSKVEKFAQHVPSETPLPLLQRSHPFALKRRPPLMKGHGPLLVDTTLLPPVLPLKIGGFTGGEGEGVLDRWEGLGAQIASLTRNTLGCDGLRSRVLEAHAQTTCACSCPRRCSGKQLDPRLVRE